MWEIRRKHREAAQRKGGLQNYKEGRGLVLETERRMGRLAKELTRP
jgi:hypothetical protein